MPLSLFHPAVATWFGSTLGVPTASQRQGWAAIRERRHTLIAAPTGSGKTLAAFLTALDDLFREGLEAPLPDETRIVYVSPLKALSADIHRNLAEPRRGIASAAKALGLTAPRITVAVRSGDTTQAERAAMLRQPPHILVTTPESLYLLLTGSRSREMLRTARTVIIDEIHAVIGTRRGAHLALTLERLQRVAETPLVRLGLSATQKPIEDVARYLVGSSDSGSSAPSCTIVDEGHRRAMDLGLEMPRSALEAVMSHEVWSEYYARLAELIAAHRTTLIFVNTRRMAERVARQLSERLGEEAVTAHHGSLSKETRLDAEARLKDGRLKALVATASLELGIDIGYVDLVCQIGSPHRIATLLQRVGRSGHTVQGLPKGRLFPVSRDDLIECAALLRAIGRGELDAIVSHDQPLDVLAQQVVAEASCADSTEDELYALVRRAWPYRALERSAFDRVIQMTADGFATRRGRRAALVHRDEVNARVRGRRGSRSLAITSGGAIPEVADYRVVLDPDDSFIGTLNEDFAIESTAGDVFQLGNASWQILQVGAGTVRVRDAQGAPPTLPFWLGEAPARSDELSRAVSDLRQEIDQTLATDAATTNTASAWLRAEASLTAEAADQAAAYLAESRQALGVLPTQDTLVLERFFDESGGMQLVLHAPFGSRINKAWGLALRKRFCRQFNFELQAAATEDGLLLSLGPQHSFPLSDVFRYLHSATAREVLVQAFLDAPVFQTRWRWNTTIALAVPRNRHGKKVAPQLQRMMADDLMAAVFPDAAACLENIAGDREIPDHPLVSQAVHDCLHEAMDFDGLASILDRIHNGTVQCIACDTTEPSPLSHELLNARPYAFLDDAPLEERRAHAVYARRAGESGGASELGALDAAAIARVCDEQRPDPRDADELHDALVTTGFLTDEESARVDPALVSELLDGRRATWATTEAAGVRLLTAAERLPEIQAVLPDARVTPAVTPPPSRALKGWARDEALVELLRGRMALVGPTTAHELAQPLGLPAPEIEQALVALESDGVVLRGRFRRTPVSDPGPGTPDSALGTPDSALGTPHPALGTPHPALGTPHPAPGTPHPAPGTRHPAPGTALGTPDSAPHSALSTRHSALSTEWCDRSLLARIHRYTLNRLRAEIEAVSPADFVRFLFDWHGVSPASRLSGTDGLLHVLGRLDGFELAAGAWERHVLPGRVDRYEPAMLDMLCLTGQVGWARLSESGTPSRLGRATPVALFLRDHGRWWKQLATADNQERPDALSLSLAARAALEALRARGASFAHELTSACALDAATVQQSLAELVSAGLVASDGFAGLRGLMGDNDTGSRANQTAGRWALVKADPDADDLERAVEMQARALLQRYGVVCRRLLARETHAQPWRVLARAYRRLEARGEIRGGRFVSGLSGEQFALPDAVERLRDVRRRPADRALIVLSGADPLNVAGIVTAGERVAAVASTRIAYRDGVPLAVMEGDYIRPLATIDPSMTADVASALAGRRVPAVVSGFVGRMS